MSAYGLRNTEDVSPYNKQILNPERRQKGHFQLFDFQGTFIGPFLGKRKLLRDPT